MIDDADDLLAAELAFGLLDADDRAAAERRLDGDAAFATRVGWWREHSAGLLAGFDAAPPGTTWQAIARRLPANDDAPSGSTLRWWQAATAIAASVALLLGASLLLRSPPRVAAPVVRITAPPLVAVLTAPGRSATIAVSYDTASHRLALRPAGLEVGTRDAELWVIPAGGAPASLGVIASDTPTRRDALVARSALLVPGATLAITLEQAGGSPTGKPTGAVILSGTIAQS